MFGFLAALAGLPRLGLDTVDRTVLTCAAAFLPIVVLDLLVGKVHRRRSTGLLWSGIPARDTTRLAVKLSGLAGTVAVIALCYWSFPEYGKDFYGPFWLLLRRYGPWAAAAMVVYFWCLDSRLREPRDGYWHAGCLVLGFFDQVDWRILRAHLREWFIKGFFAPLMFVYLSRSITDVQTFEFSADGPAFLQVYFFSFGLLYAVDLIFAATGYFLAFRVIDSQIRTSEPTALGWAAALVCYVPFNAIVFDRYLSYDNDFFWDLWLAGHPVLLAIWGSTILLLLTVYALASAAFGCRFSNLTHRGILTNGPYRLTKHPAYIAKNLSWWLISVPFIPALGWGDALKACLLLLGVNLVYFVRARTEENHLSWDPAYVRYALWINEHGVFRWLAKRAPLFRYRPPIARPAHSARPGPARTGSGDRPVS